MRLWRAKEQSIAGFLDQGASLTGELQFTGVVRIDGDFHGSIDGAGLLVVGSEGVVHADIRVREIEIHGQVFGNLEIEARAEIYSSGTLRGDIRTPVLIVAPGGVLDGNSDMSRQYAAGEHGRKESTRIASRQNERRGSLDRDVE